MPTASLTHSHSSTLPIPIHSHILHLLPIHTHTPAPTHIHRHMAVVVAFFICWAPFHAQRLVAIYGTAEDHSARSPGLVFVYSIVTYSSGVLYYMSTCINPILYHIMSNKFREAFKNTMLQWCGGGARGARPPCSYSPLALAQHPTSSGTDNSGQYTTLPRRAPLTQRIT
ncbi:Pyrokinin-1 receptor [Eumeta japonica]|uniref:Pyrokinin-1 receptor n=1 Tax=Eumeta variegata TaxID=151549 RepID=A0A4C1XQN4_EUMVA|nr:Pyrokinin-1 receptor [Eumeta japonica]